MIELAFGLSEAFLVSSSHLEKTLMGFNNPFFFGKYIKSSSACKHNLVRYSAMSYNQFGSVLPCNIVYTRTMERPLSALKDAKEMQYIIMNIIILCIYYSIIRLDQKTKGAQFSSGPPSAGLRAPEQEV